MPPEDVLAHVAMQAVLAVVRDTTDPIDLFARHHNGEDEYGLVVSVAGERSCDDVLNLIDSGYLLRWHELTSDGRGPEELPLSRAGVDLSDFSPSQREVVQAGDGPLSVLAGPGSGKTTVLAGRIAYLVDQRGIPPFTIMAITFTTAAAATLRQRLAGVLGTSAQDLTITTFHALGLRLIKQWSRELGFGHVPAVYGKDDASALLRQVAAGFGIEVGPKVPGRAVDPWSMSISRLAHAVDRFRLASSTGAAADQGDDIDSELLASMSTVYEEQLKRHGAVDYPAMLTLPLRLFEIEPRALRLMQDAYRFVTADEFQDTSRTQLKLLELIVDQHRNLAVVGDPKQAIFTWLGADPTILVEFPHEFPDARVFPLDQNHRSTGVVVALSNGAIVETCGNWSPASSLEG